MMSALTEEASQIGFILAFAAHLDSLKTKLDAVSEDPTSSVEQCCYVEELSIGLRVVKNYGLRTLASAPDGPAVHAACSLLNAHLVGPGKRSISLSTEEIIGRVDDNSVAVNPLVQDQALLTRLNGLLCAAVQMATDLPEQDSQPVTSYISQLLVSYLDAQEAATPQKISLGGLSSAALSYLRGDGEQPVGVSWEAVYSLFKRLLLLQVSSAPYSTTRVLESREIGNNLMVNCSYPQAIKVYTEAIEGAGFGAANNLPQLYTNRAIAFIGLNCFKESVSDLEAAVSLDRTFTPAWVQLGYCHLYLGQGLLALKCYLVALRTMAGEIYPEHFSNDASSRSEYTEAKMNAIFPQFVSKLVSSILLTEKRAEQQQEPASSIQEITTRVRAILARLRSYVADEDLPYLSYAYETDIDSMRATAARANRVRPTVLNSDVAQDILASTSVEASAVSISPPPLATFTTQAIPNRTSSPGIGEETPEPSIREMFNNLGEVFASVVPGRESETEVPRSETGASGTEAASRESESGSANETNARENTRGHEQPGAGSANQEDPDLDPVWRGLASAQRALAQSQNGNGAFTIGGYDVGGGFSNIISQALRNHQAAYARTRGNNREETRPGGVRMNVHHHPPRPANPTPAQSRTEGGQAGSERNDAAPESRVTDSPRPEDTEMPDAQDLD